MSDEKIRQEARDLWLSLGRDECAYPTPEHLLGFFRACSDEVGLDLAQRLIQASEDAHRCWEFGHDHEIRFWKTYAQGLTDRMTAAPTGPESRTDAAVGR